MSNFYVPFYINNKLCNDNFKIDRILVIVLIDIKFRLFTVHVKRISNSYFVENLVPYLFIFRVLTVLRENENSPFIQYRVNLVCKVNINVNLN